MFSIGVKIYNLQMYCTWSFQVFGTKGVMSLICTEICNIVVFPDRCTRSYLHNSQVQLLLMGMYVENTVKKLELVVLVFLEIYKVRGPCHLYTRILYIAAHELQQNARLCKSWVPCGDLHCLQLLPEHHQTAGTTTYVYIVHSHVLYMT